MAFYSPYKYLKPLHLERKLFFLSSTIQVNKLQEKYPQNKFLDPNVQNVGNY